MKTVAWRVCRAPLCEDRLYSSVSTFHNKFFLAVSKSSLGTSDLKFEVRSLKIPVQNGCQKTHTRDSNQSVIIKITQQKLKWSPKNSQNLVQTLCYLESHNSPLVSLIAFFKISTQGPMTWFLRLHLFYWCI